MTYTKLFELELFDHLMVGKQMTDIELLVIHSNTLNLLTVCKGMGNVEYDD